MTARTPTELDADPDMKGRMAIGIAATCALVLGLGGWASYANLAGAVVAPGLVVAEGAVKKVQHLSGGVVGAIRVKNGDVVQQGDVVMSLDDTMTRASLGIVVAQLEQLIGRKARLEAERDDRAELKFPSGFEASTPEAAAIAAGERSLHASNRETRDGQSAQLAEKMSQTREEAVGLDAQIRAKDIELKLIFDELARVEEMFRRGNLPITRVTPLKREQARIEGERGALISSRARARSQISELQLQVIGLLHTTRTEALRQLREVDAKIAELAERRIAAEDQLKRIDLRAPVAGLVHELAVHTVGGVITAGEPVMLIVPQDSRYAIDVRVAQSDIDQATLGRGAMLRFPAFNQRTTPEVEGIITRVGADISRDPQTGQSYFQVRMRLKDESAAKLAHLELLPGMPVEAMIQTGQRTALSYILKPVADQLAKTFLEE